MMLIGFVWTATLFSPEVCHYYWFIDNGNTIYKFAKE